MSAAKVRGQLDRFIDECPSGASCLIPVRELAVLADVIRLATDEQIGDYVDGRLLDLISETVEADASQELRY